MTYAYDAFGNVRSQSAGHANDWLFAGEQRDQESGYDYLRARYYDPGTGRFSLDPLGGGYPYAANNPVRFVDPTGLYQICGDDEVWGWICFDSTQVNHGACDGWANCYIWTPSGNIEIVNSYDDACVFADGSLYHCYRNQADAFTEAEFEWAYGVIRSLSNQRVSTPRHVTFVRLGLDGISQRCALALGTSAIVALAAISGRSPALVVVAAIYGGVMIASNCRD